MKKSRPGKAPSDPALPDATDGTPASIVIRSQFGIVFHSSARVSGSYLLCVLPIQVPEREREAGHMFFVPIAGVMWSGSATIRAPSSSVSVRGSIYCDRSCDFSGDFGKGTVVTRAGTTWRRNEGEAQAVCKPGGAPIRHNSGGPK
jgi:hypothetical protein